MEQNNTLSVRESAHFISMNAKDVTISDKGIESLCYLVENAIANGDLEFSNTFEAWNSSHLHPKEKDDNIADWVFAVDTLNFSFWTEPGKEPYIVEYKGSKYSGYAAMVAAVNRAIDEGISITTPSYYSTVTIDTLAHIFRSETSTTIPLLEKRKEVLHEVGTVLCEKFDGKFANFIRHNREENKEIPGQAMRVVTGVLSYFPCYRDECFFAGRKVAFYKRAQIVVGDIWACFGNTGLGQFDDIAELTMFADYRVPQGLVSHGALLYSPTLLSLLKSNKVLENGSREECEIRGCSIEVVERMIAKLKSRRVRQVNAVMIDFFLWNYAKKNAQNLNSIPIHLVRSVFY